MSPSFADITSHDAEGGNGAMLGYDQQACRKLMRGGSKTFFAASLLLPARVREPATALYAFCRLADDLVDLGGDPHAAMSELQARLDALYDAQRLAFGPIAFQAARVLRDAGLEGVRVGTVDKFQGQEAPVVLVSMTASSADDVPRGMEFLLNRNRVNVAISRAQWLAVLIRSQNLTAHMPSTPERLLELGGFIGLKGESR